jgi:uncharacterized protein (TIGR00106 family)
MRITVDFCLIPLGGSISLSPYIAECQRIFRDMGVEHRLHAFGTNVEGEWDVVMEAIKRCHLRVHEMGAPRITSTVKIGSRVDRAQGLQEKVSSVRKLLKSQ